MKRLTPKQYAKILFELTVELKGEKEISNAASVFAQLLRRKSALRKLQAIMEAFVQYADEKSGKISVTVTTARTLEASVKKALHDQMNALIQSETVDEHIIGGIIVKAKSVLFDGSLRGQLQRLQQQLVQ